jgi:DNA polymerase-1
MAQYSLFHMQGGKLVTGLKCTRCALAADPRLKTNCMPGSGNANSPTYMFVGIAPGGEDDSIGAVMTGSGGKQLKQLLSEAGFNLAECYFTNCLKCSLFGESPKEAHWKGCRVNFEEELLRVNPTVVVAVGGQAVTWLTGYKGVNKLRRKLLPLDKHPQYSVYPIRQPAALFHQTGQDLVSLRISMINDLRELRELVAKNRIDRDRDLNVDYRTAVTPQDVEEIFEELEQYNELAFDFETTSLRKPTDSDRLVAVGFSFGEGVGRAIPLDAKGVNSLKWWEDGYLHNYLMPKVADFLRRKKVWGHNAIKYDQQWSRAKLGIQNLNFVYDTLLASYIIDENPGTHSLETLAMVHTSMTPWKSEFTLEDTTKLCGYLCKDVDATYRLRSLFRGKNDQLQDWLLYELLMPLSQELFEMEWHGVRIDTKALENLREYCQSKVDLEYSNLRSFREVRSFEITHNREFNVESHDDVRVMLRDYLQLKKIKQTDSGTYSTDKEVLEHYKHIPIVQSIMTIRQIKKLNGTYVVGMGDVIVDGKIHTSYSPARTVTGRLASSDPNLQNLPREDTAGKVLEDANAIKKAFVASDGYVLMQADYSQAELRTLASVSKDRNLIDIYRQGLDAHTATAARIYKIPLEEVSKAQRNSAKIVNFGIVYGMSWESLLKKFVSAGNTEEQAQAFYSGHKSTFSGVWSWLAEQERIIKKFGEQRTPFGRTRHYTEIDDAAIRQAYNFPIQSMASDLTLVSLVRCARALRKLALPARPVLTVHDSIIFEIKIEVFWEVARLVNHIMSSIHFDWMLVPMTVDMEAGYSWGDLRSIDLENQKIAV